MKSYEAGDDARGVDDLMPPVKGKCVCGHPSGTHRDSGAERYCVIIGCGCECFWPVAPSVTEELEDKWISVEDRLPDSAQGNESVQRLVWMALDPPVCEVADYDYDVGLWIDFDGTSNFSCFVTHWQPLPAAPKEK